MEVEMDIYIQSYRVSVQRVLNIHHFIKISNIAQLRILGNKDLNDISRYVHDMFGLNHNQMSDYNATHII